MGQLSPAAFEWPPLRALPVKVLGGQSVHSSCSLLQGTQWRKGCAAASVRRGAACWARERRVLRRVRVVQPRARLGSVKGAGFATGFVAIRAVRSVTLV